LPQCSAVLIRQCQEYFLWEALDNLHQHLRRPIGDISALLPVLKSVELQPIQTRKLRLRQFLCVTQALESTSGTWIVCADTPSPNSSDVTALALSPKSSLEHSSFRYPVQNVVRLPQRRAITDQHAHKLHRPRNFVRTSTTLMARNRKAFGGRPGFLPVVRVPPSMTIWSTSASSRSTYTRSA